MPNKDEEFTTKDETKCDQEHEPSTQGETAGVSPPSEEENKKTKGPYATHGIFSRAAWNALVKQGHEMKKLGQTERMLRQHFEPRNAFEEFVLDRALCCVFRCVLIAREEERVFGTAGKPGAERLKDISVLATYGGSKVIDGQTSAGLMNELNSILRYDAHYAREFTRWIGFLEKLQNGRDGGYVFGLPKKGAGKEEDN
jgi:hypothetical protein